MGAKTHILIFTEEEKWGLQGKKMERKLLFPAHTFTFLRLPPHVPPVRLHNYYGAAAAAAAAIAASSFRGCPLTYLAM